MTPQATGSPYEPSDVYVLPSRRGVREVPPNLIGTEGRAWMHDVRAALMWEAEKSGAPVSPDSTVASWIVYAPYGNENWAFYWVGCVALRPKEDAEILLPGATHEAMVYACNPRRRPSIDETPHLLTPANFHGQFIADSDERAAGIIAGAVSSVINGKLHPENFAQWAARFSYSNLKKGF